MINRKILQLIELGEGYHLELKERLDKSFIEEVCAFANSSGGKIIFGVTDKGEIKGIRSDNSFRSKIQDTATQLQPTLNIYLTVEENIIVVSVPQGSEKPYGCSRGFFVRIGPNTQKLTRNEIVSFFQKEGRVRFDELENAKAIFDNDFDYKAFEHFLELSDISKSIDKDFLLKNLDCLTENNKLTNAGVLFFAKSVEFLMPHATVVCVLYKGTEKIHIIDKKDFTGNIIENIEGVLQFVKRHINLEFKIEKIRREEIYEIPEIALREAIVNAVCHRDYFQKGANVLIEIFDDRVVLTNPGGLPADLSPEEFGTKSVTRNSVIATLLLRADYIEKMGTGIARMREAIEELGKGSVDFTFTAFFTTRFSRPSFARGSVKTTSKTTTKTTTNQLDIIIALIRETPTITAKELSAILNITEEGVRYHLKKLKKISKIKHIGPAKGGHWEIIGNDNRIE